MLQSYGSECTLSKAFVEPRQAAGPSGPVFAKAIGRTILFKLMSR